MKQGILILGLVVITTGVVRCFFNGFPFGDIFENSHHQSDDESYYELFGMTKATFDENALKKSYRTLLKKYHPDHNSDSDASERFGEITNAYDVLSDPEKKRLYDAYGKDGVKMGGANGNGGSNAHSSGFPFDMFFNTGSSGHSHRDTPKSHTVLVEITLSLEEIFSGSDKLLQFSRHSLCKQCSGSGAHSPSDVVQCPKCQGSGIQIVTQVIGPFIQRFQSHCEECKGAGKKIEKPCAYCKGSKVFLDDSPLHVHIPAGVLDGANIVLEGVGDAGADGRFIPGDIHCRIKEAPHPIFRRGKKDPSTLSMDLSISLRDSLLGWSTTVIDVSGNLLKISREKTLTPPGFVVEVPNGGLLKSSGIMAKRGSLFVSVSVIYPKELSSTESSIIRDKNLFHDISKPEPIPVKSRAMYPIHDDL